MQEPNPKSLLNNKDDAARVAIASRVGERLSNNSLVETDRRAAELLARALLDDAIESVRRGLSEAIKHAKYIPQPLALKLAHDVESVSCPFLASTKVFSDRDWQQLVLTISQSARVAVAGRSSMSETLANSLAKLGNSVVAETLIKNKNTPMTQMVCNTLMDRFTSEIWVLDNLALRDDLITKIVLQLKDKVSEAMRNKLVNSYKLPGHTEPLANDAETSAVIQVIKNAADKDQIVVAKALFNQNKLTPSLLLKALEINQNDFLEAGLSVLSGLTPEQVRSVILLAGKDAMDRFFKRARIPDEIRSSFQVGFQKRRKQ